MGKHHKSYAAKKKSLKYIKAQRKGIKKEICISNHNKNFYITQLERQIEIQKDEIFEQELKLKQRQEELQQQQQLVSNLECEGSFQEERIQSLEKRNQKLRGAESKLLSENTKNLKRALGAEGTIKDLKFKIKSLKRQLNK